MIVDSMDNIALNYVIFHNINKKEEELELSDLTSVIDDDLNKLVKTHIFNSIRNEKRRYANFNAPHGDIKEACIKCLNNENDFIEGSKLIAELLYERARKDLKAASILVSNYSYNGTNYLAFLKLDYIQNLMANKEKVDDKIRITVSKVGTGIPGITHKLQKAFFFQINNIQEDEDDNNNDFDIIVIDNEADYNDNDIADFFIKSFLKANLIRNNKDNTIKFMKIAQKFSKKYYKNNDDVDKLNDFNDRIYTILNDQNIIDINSLANDLFVNNEQLKLEFINTFNNANCEMYFEIDKNYVNENLKKKNLFLQVAYP